eukprot:11560556-Karenia_brevis.AAC.1
MASMCCASGHKRNERRSFQQRSKHNMKRVSYERAGASQKKMRKKRECAARYASAATPMAMRG